MPTGVVTKPGPALQSLANSSWQRWVTEARIGDPSLPAVHSLPSPRPATGAPWRDIPERYGSWKTCHVPYMAVFKRVAVAVQMGLIDHEYVYRFCSSRFRRLLRMGHVRHLMVTQSHGWQHLISLAVDLDDWVEEMRRGIYGR